MVRVRTIRQQTKGDPIQTPNHTPFPSHVSLAPTVRAELIVALNSLVATSTDLATQCKMAHWNTRGPTFYARHELFDEAASQVRAWTDNLAERAGVLGGYAMGSVRFAATESVLPDYATGATTGMEHLKALIRRFALYCGALRGALTYIEERHDPVTADILVQTLREAEQLMWTLDSHLLPADPGMPRPRSVDRPPMTPTAPPNMPETVVPAVQSMKL